MKLYYDLELAKDLRRKLRFYFREIELFSASNEAHVNEILGEIYYQEMTCVDPQVRIYMARKIKELRAKHPRMKA